MPTAPPPPRLLDVTGHFCPLPVLFAARTMLRLRPGDRLELLGDDPAMREDVPAWCEHAGHRLLAVTDEEGGRLRFLIAKGDR
jgi:tRNA 2-thiouridine synthesizing protein A